MLPSSTSHAPLDDGPDAGQTPGTHLDAATRSPRAWRFRPGDELVPGRRVLKLLGGGDRYEAYLVWDERLFAPLVAKVLRPNVLASALAREAIDREARALARLQHPVLVRSFGAHLEGDRPHVLLEFLDGPRLSTLTRRYGPLSSEQLVGLARQLSSALEYISREGWVHLDVKPRNIIVMALPRLIDLSVARPVAETRSLTRHVGTDAYMAPEQCDPARFGEIGPAADIWGLGATLFEALTGRQAFPFQPDGPRFPQLRGSRPVVPPKAPALIRAVIEHALSGRPEDRPTAAELYEMLEPVSDWAARGVRRFR